MPMPPIFGNLEDHVLELLDGERGRRVVHPRRRVEALVERRRDALEHALGELLARPPDGPAHRMCRCHRQVPAF